MTKYVVPMAVLLLPACEVGIPDDVLDRLDALEGQVTILEGDVSTLQGQVTALETALEECLTEEDLDDHETRISDVESWQATAEAELVDHDTRISDLEAAGPGAGGIEIWGRGGEDETRLLFNVSNWDGSDKSATLYQSCAYALLEVWLVVEDQATSGPSQRSGIGIYGHDPDTGDQLADAYAVLTHTPNDFQPNHGSQTVGQFWVPMQGDTVFVRYEYTVDAVGLHPTDFSVSQIGCAN